MAKLRWALLCDRAIVEAETNNLSIVSVIDMIRLQKALDPELATREPAIVVPHKFAIVQVWDRAVETKPEQLTVRLEFASPVKKKSYASLDQLVDLSKYKTVRAITQCPGFPWRGPGVYTITIKSKSGRNWRTVKQLSYRVVMPGAATSTVS